LKRLFGGSAEIHCDTRIAHKVCMLSTRRHGVKDDPERVGYGNTDKSRLGVSSAPSVEITASLWLRMY